MTTTLFILAILAGFAILIWGANRFVDGAANMASNFGISPLIIGLTIVGFGTSAPEMLVSALAAFGGAPALGIGNALGSNIANIGLVLGVTTLITPLIVHSDTLRREFPVLALVMALALALMWDGELSRVDGIILFTGFLFTLTGMAFIAFRSSKDDPLEQEFEQKYAGQRMETRTAVWLFISGLVALLVGSKALVWGATGIAHLLGVSDLVIGLTVVAIGTSLPELAASIASALKHEHDIAVGNVLGSNIFNLLAVLALPGIITPSHLDPMLLKRDFLIMVLVTLLLYLFARFCSKGRVGRPAGILLLLTFIGYNCLLAYQSIQGTI